MTALHAASFGGHNLLHYEEAIETEVAQLAQLIADTPSLSKTYAPRWLAIQLLEGDETLRNRVDQIDGGAIILTALERSVIRLQQHYGDDVDITMTDQRYRFVHNLIEQVLTRPTEQPMTLSDRIDRIVTHRWLGIPIFLALMWGVFKITTDVAAPFLDWVDGLIGGPLSRGIVALLGMLNLGGTWIESLIVDGIVAGVGGVLVFVPVLVSLYLALGLLEDSGYMARAAFVMDRLMRTLGLHGKSFLPMIVGFGCSVPAIYATRTLESRRDRILTGLLVPFMSCSARLPVYVLIAAIFFPTSGGLVIFSLYVTGIVVAIMIGMLLKSTLFDDQEATPFVMELPPYRLPTWRGIWQHVWQRTSAFVRKAWTLIMVTSIVVWFLLATPMTGQGSFAETNVSDSAFAAVAGATAPVFAPMGFDSWEASGALITGFVAKEVVVSTMAQVHNVEEVAEEAAPATFGAELVGIGTSFVDATVDTLKSIPLIIGINLFEAEEEGESPALMGAVQQSFEASSGGHGALAAAAFLVFVLLYTPCMVAAAAARHEFGIRWMWFSIIGQFAIAWLAACLVFQGGLLLGLG